MIDREKRDQLIRGLAAEGYTKNQIAVRAGCSRATVYRVLTPGGFEAHRQASLRRYKANPQAIGKAMRAGRAQQQDRLRDQATNSWQPWTSVDVQIAIDASLTVEQAAKLLRRTPYAVRAMRWQINREGSVTIG